MSALDWLEPDEIGSAVIALREAAGLTREHLTDLDVSTNGSALLIQQIELIEDHGALNDLYEIDFYADALEMLPGEFLDAVIAVAEAQRIDVQGEIEDNAQADKLANLLSREGAVTHKEMEANGVSIYNTPFNILYDRGVPVEIWMDKNRRAMGVKMKSQIS